nr:hypothetical protein CFP56_41819 [Quercus suber]
MLKMRNFSVISIQTTTTADRFEPSQDAIKRCFIFCDSSLMYTFQVRKKLKTSVSSISLRVTSNSCERLRRSASK